MQPLETPYQRVAGLLPAALARTFDVDAVLAERAAQRAAAAAASSLPLPCAAATEDALAGPSAVTTASARELHALRRQHVAPRWAPSERFSDGPMTASQEVGWRVAAALPPQASGAGARPTITPQ